METQSVLVPRDTYTLAQAKQWVSSHNYKSPKVDITKRFYRFRQHDPSDFGRMRTVRLHGGVELIVGLPKSKG